MKPEPEATGTKPDADRNQKQPEKSLQINPMGKPAASAGGKTGTSHVRRRRRPGGATAALGGSRLPVLALTVTEAAAALGVSEDFFHKHIDGELRWVRRGSKKLVAVRELERWLEREAARRLE